MEKLINERKEYVNKIMKEYVSKSDAFLNDAQEIFNREEGFRNYMKEKISVSSYQKGLNDFIEETNKIRNRISKEKEKTNELINDFALKDNEFSVNILTNTRTKNFVKKDVEEQLKLLEIQFNDSYKTIIDNYNEKLDALFERIKKMVELNRKFVVEYGGLQLTSNPTENEYKPIYDIHDSIYENFIYEFQTEALRINFLPEQIKNTYTRIVKLLDENYDIFDDLMNDLKQNTNE